jgi:hypothetical protein
MSLSPVYYVGQAHPYSQVNQALAAIRAEVLLGDISSWPSEEEIKVILTDNSLYWPIKLEDGTTQGLADNGKKLVITRQEYTSSGDLVTNSIPKISSYAIGASELPDIDKVIAVNIGDNNPNVVIQGLMIQDAIIGVYAGFNSHNFTMHRSFVTNCKNVQCYIRDLDTAFITNNLLIGGEFGLVSKNVKRARIYYNTVFLDGVQTLSDNEKVLAGIVLQTERSVNYPSTEFVTSYDDLAFFIGNLIYTVGAPALILYHDDLNPIYTYSTGYSSIGKIVSNFNNLYSDSILVQVRQDNIENVDFETQDVVTAEYETIDDWRNAYPLAQLEDDYTEGVQKKIDANSLAIDPLFIELNNITSDDPGSIVNLWLLTNSPILGQVPNFNNNPSFGTGYGGWENEYINLYIPSDLDLVTIATDCLLKTREVPMTAIGANDSTSINGFFGEDIFTGPFSIDPNKACDTTPIEYVLQQKLDLLYPSILAGYFWSHERPYYLYGKKGVGQLGFYAKTTFDLPGRLNLKKDITIKVRDEEISEKSWDITGDKLAVYHKDIGIKHYEDEVQVNAEFIFWDKTANKFSSTFTYYIFKIEDGKTEFCLPDDYEAGAPIVITDDRVNYKNDDDITKSDFIAEYKSSYQKTVLKFDGTKNLFNNSDFTYSTDYIAPKYWETPPYTTGDFARTFMLDEDYSYWGDNALGINIGYDPGTLGYKPIKINTDSYLTFSWHSMVPLGIHNVTGVMDDGESIYNTGSSLKSVTSNYVLNFYDIYGSFMPDNTLTGAFNSYEGYYTRHALTVGPSGSLVTGKALVDSINIEYLNNFEPVTIPKDAGSIEFSVSGANLKSGFYYSGVQLDSFIAVDAFQAERSKDLTYYSPRPDFQNMTVEYETDFSGVFIDKNLNITPAYHDDPNGFLYIHDMPASLWGGPKNAETTSLHEYRWAEGRILYLPWSRVWGKDKLSQKHIEGDIPQKSEDIIAPYVYSKFASEITLVPSSITTVQNEPSNLTDYISVGADFGINVVDNIGNAYHLRNYQASIYEENGKFPGWLSKTYFGVKEQLGDSLFGSLSANGSMNGLYTPPPNTLIRYIGPTPSIPAIPPIDGSLFTTGETTAVSEPISMLKMPYRISLETQGNPTIEVSQLAGISGTQFLRTEGASLTTGIYLIHPNGENNTPYSKLSYIPKIGTVRVLYGSEEYNETPVEPSMSEFSVDYEYGNITFTKGFTGDSAYIEFIPKYVTVNPSNPNYLNFVHNKVFGSYQGQIEINYDAELLLEFSVEQPVSGHFTETFPVIAQNNKASDKKHYHNKTYGEYF